ncbi:MAG: hypothetical protein EOS18_31320 [Mesorhizobium sp.]|nr:MAG: hypothetical protein EOS18_31320 [Mesorhizobium sp.]
MLVSRASRRGQGPSIADKMVSGRYEHRNIAGGVGHNLPQEAPQDCHRRCLCRRWQLAVRISSKSPGRREQFLHNVGSFHQPGSTSMLVARVAIRRRSALGRNSVFRVAFGSGHDDAHADLNVRS